MKKFYQTLLLNTNFANINQKLLGDYHGLFKGRYLKQFCQFIHSATAQPSIPSNL